MTTLLATLLALAASHTAPSALPPLTDSVVYEENLRAEGPKPGFKAVTARLDSIKALGVNVLWLMPVTPVGKVRSAGGLGSPYAFADFTKVNPEFGTEDDFRFLIKQAHERKIAVIIDWVANHSSWDNPWIKDHDDWYLHDASGKIIPPPGTNWNDVAQLDYRNHAVWTAMIGAMQGWVNRFGIDGFRCDSAEFVPVPFWKEAVGSLRAHTHRPLFMLAEGWKPELCAAGFDLAYGWHFCDRLVAIAKGRKASDLAAAVGEENQGMPAGALRLRFVTNHDKYAWDGTPLEQFQTTGAIKIGFAMEAFYGGVPLIYSGQEVNWPDRIPIFDDTTIDWSSGAEMRSWIAKIMAVRHAQPALRDGQIRDDSTTDVVVLHRTLENEEALVLANFRSGTSSTSLPSAVTGTWMDGFTGAATRLGDEVSLPGYGLKILVRKR